MLRRDATPPLARTLRSELSENTLSTKRAFAVWTLVALATLTTLGASLTIWTKRQLLDTNEWTKSSSQLLADRNVRDVVSQKVVDLINQRADLRAQLNRALPKQARGITPVAAVALEAASVRTVSTFLGTAQAQALWAQINRRTHAALVRALEGKSTGPIETSKGGVVLDLGPLVAGVAKQLGVAGRLKANPVNGKILLVRSNELANAQHAVRAIRILSVWLTLLALALYALAVFLARGRRRGLLEAAGVSVILVGFVLLIVRRMVGDAVVNTYVSTESYRPAIRSAWLIETRLLANLAIALIAYGAAAIIAGFLGGPSRPARAIRRTLVPVFRQRRAVFHTAVLFLFLAVLAWGPTTGTQRLFGLTILAALTVIGIELWRRQTLREFPLESAPAKRRTASPAKRPPR